MDYLTLKTVHVVSSVFLQVRMARLADTARRQHSPLPQQYWTLARRWELLGYPAFAAMLVVFYLMVAKPA